MLNIIILCPASRDKIHDSVDILNFVCLTQWPAMIWLVLRKW